MVRTRVGLDPRLVLIKVWVLFVPESRDSTVSGPNPTQRGPGPIPGVRFVPVGILDFTRRSSPYIQGSGTSHGGPYLLTIPWRISSSLAMWRPWSCPAWWGQALFATRLEIAAWTSRLHTVVRVPLFQGTDSGSWARLRGGYEPAGGAKA
jgi:hypothetical protein